MVVPEDHFRCSRLPLCFGPSVIVVDESLLATALADDGIDGDLARDRIRHEELYAPDIIDLEVVSVLHRGLRSGWIPLRRAALALADLDAIPLNRVPHRGFVDRCWELRDNLTPYDVAFVAVAEGLDIPLLTADARAANAPGPLCVIEVLHT